MIAIVKLRTEYKGRPVRSECAPLNGHTLEFRRGWVMGDDDPYPGETAWIPVNGDKVSEIICMGRDVIITWLASGDLKILDEDDDFKMQKSEKEYKGEETTGICKTCDYPTELPDALACYNCWEVEHRLEVYLQSSKGRAFVADALMNATKAAITQAREKTDG